MIYDDGQELYYGPVQDYKSLHTAKSYTLFVQQLAKLRINATVKAKRIAYGYLVDGRYNAKYDKPTPAKILKKFF